LETPQPLISGGPGSVAKRTGFETPWALQVTVERGATMAALRRQGGEEYKIAGN